MTLSIIRGFWAVLFLSAMTLLAQGGAYLQCDSDAGKAEPTAYNTMSKSRFSVPKDLGTVVVPIYFHDMYFRGISGNIGYINDSTIQNWVTELNQNFAPAGFEFDVRGINHELNEDWYYANKGSSQERAMKNALREGGAETLNIYLHNGNQGSSYASAPNQYQNDPILDGVVLVSNNAPTLTHEIGHWLGLLHTFHNNCSTTNDGIADTPAQRYTGTADCNVNRDTCPTLPGLDPLNNFMSYQFHCMNEFTPGQNQRMCESWLQYRADVIYETELDGRDNCNNYSNKVFLPAGRYKLIPNGGAFNWTSGSCGWDWLVRVRVMANSRETILRAERNLETCTTSFGKFYPDFTLAAMDMNDQTLDFTVPSGGSDVSFLLRDSNCQDNQGTLYFMIVTQ